MKSTKVEIHGILYLDIDPDDLPEGGLEDLRKGMEIRFRDEFGGRCSVGRAIATCEECSVSVEVS